MILRGTLIQFTVLLLIAVKNGYGSVYFKNGGPHVKLKNGGILRGIADFSHDGKPYNSFTGIEYAKVKERFEEAELTDCSWNGTRLAVEQGPICPQVALVLEDEEKISEGEEDCLNLNVYVPMAVKSDGDHAVMVWFHGGGFMRGSGYMYGPSFFMDEDVILITVNYRLGVLGFLSIGDDLVPGNLGLKDAVLALKWIQKNIKSFGGDAGKVTVFGESAGASLTHYLMLSESSIGLFHQAISQSGSALSSFAYSPKPKETAIELANYMKCPKADDSLLISSVEIVSCFKKATVEELIAGQTLFRENWPPTLPGMHFGPTAEPHSPNAFLSTSPYDIVTGNDSSPNIPWIIGLTEDEGASIAGMILYNETLLNELDTNWDEVAPTAFNYKLIVPPEEHKAVARKLREFYFGNEKVSKETREKLVNIYSDSMFNYGVYKAVKEVMRRKSGPIYLYQYAFQGLSDPFEKFLPSPEDERKKIAHGEELLAQFDMSQFISKLGGGSNKPIIKVDSPNEKFSKYFVNLWATFARTGKPCDLLNNLSEDWKPVTEMERNDHIEFYKISQNSKMINDPLKERMIFWDKIYKN